MRKLTKESELQDLPLKYAPNDIIANTKVTITINAPGIHISAISPNLILGSVKPDEVDFYQSLWSNPEVMKKFDTNGKTRLYKDDESASKGSIDYAKYNLLDKDIGAVHQWRAGNPFNDYTIIEKRSGDKIGVISLEKYNTKHNANYDLELYSLFSPDHWRKGYGTEATVMITKAILPAIMLSKRLNKEPKNIVAKIRSDNIGLRKIAHKIGLDCPIAPTMNHCRKGAVKSLTYTVQVNTLVNSYQKIVDNIQNKNRMNKSKTLLPLFEMRTISDQNKKRPDTVNIGGHSLRNINNRALKF